MNQKELNKLVDSGKMAYCFDLDGTLCKIINATEAKPINKMIDLVNKRYDDGNYIYIF